mmetsp:Transcript_8170/g.9062  ORF Transcript_8170/g.9062 Transcript_8170/m.9062 type:complete len:395 (+) Transcript_8170:55-1239(+)
MAQTQFHDNDPWHLGIDGWTEYPCGWIGKTTKNACKLPRPNAPLVFTTPVKPQNAQPKRKTKRAGSHHNRTSKGGIPQPNPFIEHLQAAPVSLALRKVKRKVFRTTDTIKDALRLLNDAKGIYAPVMKIEDDKAQFYGFVCVFDLMGLLFDRFAAVPSWDRRTVKLCGEKFLNYPVTRILHYSKANQVNAGPNVLKSSPLFQTISIFQKRILRVAVQNDEGRVVNILDRIDIIRYLVGLMGKGKFKDFFSKTVLELELGRERVFKINSKEPMWRAFAIIHREGVDTVAVVDDEGKLEATLDAGQIRGNLIQRNPFAALQLPIKTYLQYNGLKKPLMTCDIQTPVSLILLKLLSQNHGLIGMYFVDKDNKPKSLLTLTSLMRALISHKQPERKSL